MNARPLIMKIIRGLLCFYKGCVAPFVAGSCRFHPSCSEYCVACIEQYGVVQGTVMAFRRLSRCRPGGGGGIDYP
jgi:putative membrane protein insertion efficiency factor